MRRNDLDICADILNVANKGAKKTHIVYKANLNFELVKGYLKRLMDSGFLVNYNDEGIYTTTQRGRNFLEQYSSLMIPLD
ncbi:MAG: winged helix-turn-helix domain-containing protein [Candidatus Bathyarchaeota archaeon]|jgi:predicted transcriptional regulator